MLRRLLIALVCVAASHSVFAQAAPGRVTGKITDETGGVLPGVNVELRGAAQPFATVTDADGQYVIEGVSPGTYQLAVSLINFATVNHPNLQVQAGATTTANEVMHLTLNAEVVVIGRRT